MRVHTLFGTRPEIIRLSEVIKRLDEVCDQTLVHTGQNFDPNLSDLFFEDLNLRKPDINLGIRSTSAADQIGQIITRTGEVLARERPDRLLILGDTNSGLAAFVAARLGIPVYHMEAGNRCHDDRVPEEINRRVIDHSSDVLMPYTYRSKENLVREGIARERIFVTGNPIGEVLETHRARIDASSVVDRLALEPGGYFLSTIHRAENVDDPIRLEKILRGLSMVAENYGKAMVLSVHPRTAAKLDETGLRSKFPDLNFLTPLGLFDFVRLEQNAFCVLSDSGTVQEECCIFQVPNVTVRDVTERPETIECGSNILSGAEPESILRATQVALARGRSWVPPEEYLRRDVSTAVVKILTAYRPIRR